MGFDVASITFENARRDLHTGLLNANTLDPASDQTRSNARYSDFIHRYCSGTFSSPSLISPYCRRRTADIGESEGKRGQGGGGRDEV